VQLRYLALAVVAVLALLLAAACGGGNGDGGQEAEPTATPEPQDPVQQAIGRHVELVFQREYIGDCSQADVGTDVGKMCSNRLGERGNLLAFALGNTFSEPTHYAFVEDRGGQWFVIASPPLTRESQAVPGIPWPMRPGDQVVIVGVGSCATIGSGLNVREGPGLNQRAVDCISEGTTIQIGAGPVDGDNMQWFQIQGRAGWITGTYLRFPDAVQ
jgi:hypothetical protein